MSKDLRLFTNLTVQEANQANSSKYPEVLQAILALSKLGKFPVEIGDILTPEMENYRIITINAKTPDTAAAERKFAPLDRYFKIAGLGKHIVLDYRKRQEGEQEDSYVIEIDAKAITESGTVGALVDYTRRAIAKSQQRGSTR